MTRFPAALILLLFPLLACEGRPSESQGQAAVASVVDGGSEARARIADFAKTDGQRAEVLGVPIYTMRIVAVAELSEDAYVTTGGSLAQPEIRITTTPTGGRPADCARNLLACFSETPLCLAKGTRIPLEGAVTFERSEAGWNATGTKFQLPEREKLAGQSDLELCIQPRHADGFGAILAPGFVPASYGPRIRRSGWTRLARAGDGSFRVEAARVRGDSVSDACGTQGFNVAVEPEGPYLLLIQRASATPRGDVVILLDSARRLLPGDTLDLTSPKGKYRLLAEGAGTRESGEYRDYRLTVTGPDRTQYVLESDAYVEGGFWIQWAGDINNDGALDVVTSGPARLDGYIQDRTKLTMLGESVRTFESFTLQCYH